MKTCILFARLALVGSVIFNTPAHAAVSTSNIIYINGIQNTLEDAVTTQEKIQALVDSAPNHTGTSKRSLTVLAVWNPIGWNGTASGNDLTQDKMELFLEKTAEENYLSDLLKIVTPHNQTRIVDQTAAARVVAYLDDMTPGSNSLETEGKITDSNMSRTQSAIRTLISSIERLKPAIVIAHSQGNLLANLAYAKLASTHGNDVQKYVRVINIANTSQVSVSGLNFTHASDAALFSAATAALVADQSLETMPSRGKNWTRTTPACANNGACNFTLAAPSFAKPTSNIPNQGLVDETLDHSIVDTYMSTATVPVSIDQGVSFTAGSTRFIDRFEDFIYAAATSLDLSQTTSISFFDSFDGAALDSNKWTVEAFNGNIAIYTQSNGFLNITVPGGSCGFCGVSDGARFRPKVTPIVGDFELILSAEEINRASRDSTRALSNLQLLMTGSSAELGIYVTGDVTNNQGVLGHQIITYYRSGSSVVYPMTKNLTVGQYYAFQLRIRRSAGLSYIGYKLSQDATWTETAVPSSFLPNAVSVPSIVIASGDGGGTRINSSFQARFDSVTIGQ